MSAPDKIIKLVERFDRNIDAYKQGKYNETQVRREFIDPFFKALGWDVANERGYAEAYKEVVHEDAIKVGQGTKAPDYSFRIGGARKFFVEAKRPSIDIKDDIHPAFQLRRYAWSAKLPLSILTDFEEFAVYDTRIKPNKNDKASNARVMYVTFREYPEKWEEIASIFSLDSILKGSFDKYVESGRKKRGTAEVDDAFLSEIESWRDLLARNIALRNTQLENRVLNDVVQKTIDRILFLRICEDRGVENYGQLMALLNGANIYSRLSKIFLRADERYNSGLFHFSSEKNRQEPDEISLQLAIDDKPLKDIIKRLYYPESPYEFSVLPADILGQVYERFLGKVIRLTPGHRAVVEEKPEVRKAGGVYYTPTYIVDYIVENTVGKLVEGKTPKQAEKLRILDPACGSGSFLLGAYQYLMDWHLEQYTADNPEKYLKNRSPKIYQIRSGDWRLSTSEKKRILLNNIYGVDIDTQAVEVTKLSLLLKVLEGETDETLTSQLKLFHERALPDLGNNIKCGNSLIGSDFYGGQQLSILTEDEMYRINAFDWEKEFPEVWSEIWSEPSVSAHASTQLTHSKNSKRKGGFDAVIGNPPYVEFKRLNVEIKKPIRERFESAKGKFDLFIPFIELGIRIIKEGGCISYICPSMFVKRDFGEGIRRFITDNAQIVKLTYFCDFQIFGKVTNYPIIFVIQKSENFEKTKIEIFTKTKGLTHAMVEKTLQENKNTSFFKTYTVSSKNFSEEAWDFNTDDYKALRAKLETSVNSKKLDELCKYIFVGIQSGKDEVFYINMDVISQFNLEKDIIYPIFRGEDIRRYFSRWSGTWVIYPYDRETNKVIPEKELKEKYPNVYRYLQDKRYNLRGRGYFDKSNKKWYELWCEREYKKFKTTKIIVAEISPENRFCFDTEGFLGNTKTFSLVLEDNQTIDYKYLLVILNSKLMNFYHRLVSVPKAGGYFEYKTQFLSLYPIRTIDFSNPTEKSKHDKMVVLVEQMLDLNKRLSALQGQHEKTLLQRQIGTTDRQIDQLVYELYDLTEEEIRIVEENAGK